MFNNLDMIVGDVDSDDFGQEKTEFVKDSADVVVGRKYTVSMVGTQDDPVFVIKFTDDDSQKLKPLNVTLDDVLSECDPHVIHILTLSNRLLVESDPLLARDMERSDDTVFFRMFIIYEIIRYIRTHRSSEYQHYCYSIHLLLSPWVTSKGNEAFSQADALFKDFQAGTSDITFNDTKITLNDQEYEGLLQLMSRKRKHEDQPYNTGNEELTLTTLLTQKKLRKIDEEFLQFTEQLLRAIKVNYPSDVKSITVKPRLIDNANMLNFETDVPLQRVMIQKTVQSAAQSSINLLVPEPEFEDLQLTVKNGVMQCCEQIYGESITDEVIANLHGHSPIVTIYSFCKSNFNKSISCTNYVKNQYKTTEDNQLATLIYGNLQKGAILYNKEQTNIRARWYQSTNNQRCGFTVHVFKDLSHHLNNYLKCLKNKIKRVKAQ